MCWQIDFFINIFFFFFCGTGVWAQILLLQSRVHFAEATPPVHFALVILEMGVSQTIYQGWPQTSILPILVSQGPRITGPSHWCQRAALILIVLFFAVGFASLIYHNLPSGCHTAVCVIRTWQWSDLLGALGPLWSYLLLPHAIDHTQQTVR
jgi:hypothetical protein